MPKIHEQATLDYSPKEVFDLINDIESYPLFVAHCKKATILSVAHYEVIAELVLSKGGIEKKLVTRNVLYPLEKVTIDLMHGPLEGLQGQWTLAPNMNNSTTVTLDLDFTLSGSLLDHAFALVVKNMAENLLVEFKDRAKVLYG